MKNKNLDQAVDFAIAEEKKSAALYLDLMKKLKDKGARTMLKDMANMEATHARKLADFKVGKDQGIAPGKVPNLKLAEYMVDAKLNADSGVQEVVLFAIQTELKAWRMYTAMSGLYEDGNNKKLMAALAAEELKHKNTLEKAYDDNFFKEN